MKTAALSRRDFLRRAGLAASAVSLAPSSILARNGATPPNSRINLAGIGVGGMGEGDLNEVAPGNNVVALCDVDWRRGAGSFNRFPLAKRYRDFRVMFEDMAAAIDAVVVATPDHCHAVAAMAAIQRGKHVYCEKPLAHSVHEVRELMKAARKHKVVTQLGNQGHSFDSIRTFCEMIWDGAIGKVHTIHCGCRAVNSGLDDLKDLGTRHPVPKEVAWDRWIGPAEFYPYHPAFMPGSWRGWTPFGNGTVGDWVCHVVDPVFWALDLGAPTRVSAEVENYDFQTQGLAFPKGDIITYEFPGNAQRGPISLKWYSGTQHIPRPPELEADEKTVETGAVVMGEKGTIVYGSHGASQVRLIPQAKADQYRKPLKSLPRVKNHHQDWLNAIRNGGRAGSDFAYGGPLTEIALLGIIAIKLAGQELQWDGAAGRFRNSPEANLFLNPPYREGWTLHPRV